MRLHLLQCWDGPWTSDKDFHTNNQYNINATSPASDHWTYLQLRGRWSTWASWDWWVTLRATWYTGQTLTDLTGWWMLWPGQLVVTVAEDAAPCHLGPSIDWPDFQFRSLKDGWKIRGGGYPMVIHGKGRFPMQNWLDISTCRIKARAAMSCSMLLGPNYGPGRFKPLRQSKTDSIPVGSDMTILPRLS